MASSYLPIHDTRLCLQISIWLIVFVWEVLFVEGVSLTVFLEAACRAIESLPDVLERKRAGRPCFDSRSRIVAVLVKAWLDRSYRDVEVYLHDNRETLARFNLKVHDHNTLWRTVTFLPEKYLKDLNREVDWLLKKGMNG